MHRVLLTFDDGPHPLHTPLLLDELSRRGLHAVFFALGDSLDSPAQRAILQRIAGDGHLIGNHGYSHHRLPPLPDEQIRSDFRRTEALIGSLDGGVKLWRPPFGDRDARVDSILASLGYRRMLWNVGSLDWEDPATAGSWVEFTLERIARRNERGFRNTVCLFHDTLPDTAAQFGDLLDHMGELPGVRIARYNPAQFDALGPAEDTAAVILPPDAVSFPLDDARVAARDRANMLYILNHSGSVIWEALDSGASPVITAEHLAEHYGIPHDLAARDVQSALDDWHARGLLGPAAPELEDAGPWPRSMNQVGYVPGRLSGPAVVDRVYRFLELGFRIRFQTVNLAQAVHQRFANLEVRSPHADADLVFEVAGEEENYVLCRHDAVATSHLSAASVAYQLFFEIVRLAHPDLDPMACLHSSLVDASAIDSGAGAVALIANNGGGKSTMAAALASAGMPAIADDRIFLDPATGRPAATPNAVGLKKGSWPPLLSRYPDILQLPAIPIDGEDVRFLPTPPPTARLLPPVTHVFFPAYHATARTAAIPLTSIQGLERITAADGWISAEPAKLESFVQWAGRLRCYDLPFSSLDAAVEIVRERIRA